MWMTIAVAVTLTLGASGFLMAVISNIVFRSERENFERWQEQCLDRLRVLEKETRRKDAEIARLEGQQALTYLEAIAGVQGVLSQRTGGDRAKGDSF